MGPDLSFAIENIWDLPPLCNVSDLNHHTLCLHDLQFAPLTVRQLVVNTKIQKKNNSFYMQGTANYNWKCTKDKLRKVMLTTAG